MYNKIIDISSFYIRSSLVSLVKMKYLNYFSVFTFSFKQQLTTKVFKQNQRHLLKDVPTRISHIK